MLKWVLLYILGGGLGTFSVLMIMFAVNCQTLTNKPFKDWIKSYNWLDWHELVKWPVYLISWPIVFPIGIYSIVEVVKACKMLKKLSDEIESRR